MPDVITVFRQGETWAEVGPHGFSNETGGYPPGWAEAASPEELVAAHAARLEVPPVPAGKVCIGRAVEVHDLVPTVVLDLRDMTEAEVEAKRAECVGAVKAEAGRRIVDRFPVWKQANMNMRATELVGVLLDRELTPEETTEREALLTAAAWIKAVRVASDDIEAALPDDAEALSAFSAAAAAGWPA